MSIVKRLLDIVSHFAAINKSYSRHKITSSMYEAMYKDKTERDDDAFTSGS